MAQKRAARLPRATLSYPLTSQSQKRSRRTAGSPFRRLRAYPHRPPRRDLHLLKNQNTKYKYNSIINLLRIYAFFPDWENFSGTGTAFFENSRIPPFSPPPPCQAAGLFKECYQSATLPKAPMSSLASMPIALNTRAIVARVRFLPLSIFDIWARCTPIILPNWA